jgi:hypothetical protein
VISTTSKTVPTRTVPAPGAQFSESPNFELVITKLPPIAPRLRELPRLVQEHAPRLDRPPPGDDIL